MRRCQFATVNLKIAVFVLMTVFGGAAYTGGTQQEISPGLLQQAPYEFQKQFVPRLPAPHLPAKVAGWYSLEDWAAAIDATWGEGLPRSEKIAFWNEIWTLYDESFACFNGLDSNIWDSVANLYTPEINNGVSRGRFSAILQHASLTLQDSHTRTYDKYVHSTALAPGVPLMYVGDYGLDSHFGAALTPMPDSTLLVYNAVPAHPLGLESGDLVLGYDGIRWKELYQELLAAQLPLTGNSTGSSRSSFTHRMLMGAGRNWHLFDTIDVVKFTSGDTVHLPTSELIGGTDNIFNSEQMDIPGVPKPDMAEEQLVSWGIVEGTQIGYIYCWGWWSDADARFYNAIDSLWNVFDVTGLIIDFRLNYGGNMFLGYPGLGLLYDDTVRTIKWYERCFTHDHFCMRQATAEDAMTIFPDSNTYYYRPIAVLVGPGAISAGDQVALCLAFHPRSKFFGRPTDGTFNGPLWPYPNSIFSIGYAYYESKLNDGGFKIDTGIYLTRSEFPSAEDYPDVPFAEVWLTPEGVAAGCDDVVEAAVEWIFGEDIDQDGFPNDIDNCPNESNPAQLDTDADGIGDVCDDCMCYNFCDMDGGSGITPMDVIFMVNYVYRQLDARPALLNCPNDNGDWDCDGAVDPVDVVYYVNYVYKNSGIEPCDPCDE